MANIYKVREHTAEGDILLYHSSADVVMLDEKKVPGLGDNVESALLALSKGIDGNSTPIKVTISASAFTGKTAPYQQEIAVEGIKETDTPVVGILYSDDPATALKQRDAWGSVHRITCSDGKITVYCYEDKPTADIPIQIKLTR